MDKEQLLLEKWKMASELHRHEDNVTWQKFNYFVTLNAALLTVLAVIWSSGQGVSEPLKWATVAISVLGMLASLTWALMTKRGHLYHLYRGAQAKEAERALKIDDEQILDLYEKTLHEQTLVTVPKLVKLGVHRLICSFSVIVAVGWFALIIFLLAGGMNLLM